MNPKHIKQVSEARKATAPYNFVELPDRVVDSKPLPSADRYHLDHRTGRIECTLTTETPLYTRCGWNPDEFAEHGKKSFPELSPEKRQERGNFFINPATGQPMIPGSSLRGMLRGLIEIASFSKIDQVTDEKLFYRSLGDRALQTIYQANFIEDLGEVQHQPHPKAKCYRSKVRAGYLRYRGHEYVLEECEYGRIDHQKILKILPNIQSPNLYQGSNPSKKPNWLYQNKSIYVDIDPSEEDYFFSRKTNRHGKERHPDLYLRFREIKSASLNCFTKSRKGILVITGYMQAKHLEFVFLDGKIKEYRVSENLVKRFLDDDQITKWQVNAYPKDQPEPNCRPQNGYLRDGEPIFFLLEEDMENVRFFGRAQMFRLPYDYSPLNFVPPTLRNVSLTDIAEALFGYVNGKDGRDQSRVGRVSISDGKLSPNQNIRDQEQKTILLSSPKPTAFQHYLVQHSDRKEKLAH